MVRESLALEGITGQKTDKPMSEMRKSIANVINAVESKRVSQTSKGKGKKITGKSP